MALALMLGCSGPALVLASPLRAQEYSREWRAAAMPVSEALARSDQDEQVKALIAQAAAAQGEQKQELVARVDSSLDGVLAKVRALVPLASTPDDKYSTGQFHLNFGNKLRDPALQYQGLKLMVDSGRSAPEQLPLLSYYVGSLAWDRRDLATAREYLVKAYELGHKDPLLERLIGETYFAQGQFAEGLQALDRMFAQRGPEVAEDTYRRALQIALEEGLTDQIVRRACDLVRNHPSQASWNASLRVVLESFDLTADEAVDLYRLMNLAGALRDTRNYVDYINAADPRRMANEVLPLIDEGIARGLLSGDDAFVKEAREVALARATEDRAAADEDAAAARAASDPVSARAAADNFLALGNFVQAEDLYRLALQRAPDDSDRLNMRIGVSQARQGKLEEARASFEAVKGRRANVAAMWLTWLDTRNGE